MDSICRICLGNKRTLQSIFERDKNVTYSEMITSLSNVKITKDDTIINQICRKCRKKLREAYDFKMLIERSYAALSKTEKVKKLNFYNINDIKIEVNIENDIKPFITKYEDITEHFRGGVKEISHNDTVIKKLETSNVELRKPIPILDFLKTIKEEPNDENFYNQNCASDYDSYGPGSGGDDDYIPPYKLLKTDNLKRKYKKRCATKKGKTKAGWNQNKENKLCIKPVYLRDLRLCFQKVDKTPAVRKKRYLKKQEMCPHCGKLSRSLKSHMLTHTGERTFKCDECGKGFYTKNMLSYHMKNHTNIRDFKCELCVAAFKDKRALKSHMVTHNGEKKFVCDVCNKGFLRRCALRRHIMVHYSANKTVNCELCNMSFYEIYGLRNHMRVHTGERPYNCEICSQPYSYKHDFNRHCFKKHGVFLKRRSVYVMNEEVLKREKILMRDLMLRVRGVIKDGKPLNPFDGPQAALAFEQAVKALESKQISIDPPTVETA